MVHIDNHRMIVPVNNKQYVLSDKDKKSEFSYLSVPHDESGFESIRPGRARNGYSVLTFISTADSVTIGVSADFKVGFYSYRASGSGNGNSKFDLKCRQIK